MKGALLRVGIDLGYDTGNYLSPIFGDETFEFIPIREGEENKSHPWSYRNISTKNNKYGNYLSDFLPERLHNYVAHNDPEFITPSYGEPKIKNGKINPKVFTLSKLNKGDLLVFHAGFYPSDGSSKSKKWISNNRLNYIIGYFIIDCFVDLTIMKKPKKSQEWNELNNNPHIGYRKDVNSFIIVGDAKKSNFLKYAYSFSRLKKRSDGILSVALTKEMTEKLGIDPDKPFIERSTPRLISNNGCEFLLQELENYV